MRDLLGLHHITAMTADVEKNYQFFTEVLGMRLVKKTINQDDLQAYHTYYADHIGTPGTTMTFFYFPQSMQGRPGNNSISRVGLRVPSDAALEYYAQRFKDFGVKHGEIEEQFGKKFLKFEEEDGQRYWLVSDENNEGMAGGEVWELSPVPAEYAVYGLGVTEITVSYADQFIEVLQDLYGFELIQKEGSASLLEIGEGGNGAQIIVVDDPDSPSEQPGDGTVHHMAFRVDNDEALHEWAAIYQQVGLPTSGVVERHYFGAVYARVGHILIEISTDEPGFTIDEPYETLGESLALPEAFEDRRAEIEAGLRPFDTTVDRS